MESILENKLENLNEDVISKDYTFFPITGLQVGKWLSAFHSEKQLFLYQPNPEIIVFLAVHSEDKLNLSLPYFLTYTRKKILKMCKNSPFTAPVSKKNTEEVKGSVLKRLSAEYGGIVAFEINLKNIEGLDYSNTLNSYGSRITLEVNKAKKLWFCNAFEFCKYYHINQSEIKTKYYSPILSISHQRFKTKQINPCDINKQINKERLETQKTCDSNTPAFRKPRIASRRTTSEANLDMIMKQFDHPYEANFHECEYNHFTIAAYFDDPIFPFFVKNLLKQPKNKYLLTMYERGIPSWAQFLPSYGLPYRPWMRRVIAVVIFLFSLITMLLGFYDLYKSIPELREVMVSVFGIFFETFEKLIILRLNVVLSYIFASSQFFFSILTTLFFFDPFVKYLIDACNYEINFLIVSFYESVFMFNILEHFLALIKTSFLLIFSGVFNVIATLFYMRDIVILFLEALLSVLYYALSIVIIFGKEMKDIMIFALSLPLDIVYGLTYGFFDVIFELSSDFYSFISTIIKA